MTNLMNQWQTEKGKNHTMFRLRGYLWTLPFVVACYLTPSIAISQQHGQKVVVERADMRPLVEEVRLSGSVVAPRIAELSVQVSGQIDSLFVELGERVKTGAEILRLDSELEALALAEAHAATEKATVELDEARRRLADAEKLSKSLAISADQVNVLSSQVRAGEAEFRRIRAQEQRWEARLNRHQIIAPFEGVISQKWAELGEWLDPGDPAVELTAVNNLHIDFQAPQIATSRLDQDTEIVINFDALPGKSYDGLIDWMMPVANTQTRTFLLRTALQEEKVPLASGMSASAVLRLRSDEQALTVSRDALLRHSDGRVTLWVVEDNGESARVAERQVQTGAQFDGRVAIIKGLSAGEVIVVRGNESLRDGQIVNIQEGLGGLD